jgi:1-acyl-sn-glycerol-3-phosphate acyltransferase
MTRSKFIGSAGAIGLFCLMIIPNVGILIATFLYPKVLGLYFLIPYYAYNLSIGKHEARDGNGWNWFSENFFVFNIVRGYLNLKIEADSELKEAEAKEGAQFVFAVSPHGTNADYRVFIDGMLHEALPQTASKIRTLAATVLFHIPLVREIALWTGCVDASRAVAVERLKEGRSLLVIPGGQAEQMYTQYGRERVYLKRRKGFLKLCLKYEIPVVPAYVFGVSDYYFTSAKLFGLRMWLVQNLGIALPLCWGRYGLPICPRPVDTTLVFDKPLYLSCQNPSNPSEDEVDKAHLQFCQALEKLFDTHKERLGYGDRKLEII